MNDFFKLQFRLWGILTAAGFLGVIGSDRKAQLKQEIEVITAEFRIKRKNARYSLFMKT